MDTYRYRLVDCYKHQIAADPKEIKFLHTDYKPCGWCSSDGNLVYHPGACPWVDSIEYYPSGAIKRVTFKPGSVNKDVYNG